MNIVIVVHDLILEKWHLMPWRTVVEVVRHLRSQGHEVILVSLEASDIEITPFESPLLPDGTLRISKLKHHLDNQLFELQANRKIDVMFWPITWREPRWRTKVLSRHAFKTIGWFPGGVYTKLDSLFALRKMGFKSSLPYLIEAFYPKKVQLGYMHAQGIDALLSMTQATSDMATKNGWSSSDSFVIPPGKDPVDLKNVAIDNNAIEWLGGCSYLLFMGPPSAIRGVYELLDAFEIAAKKSESIRLICLFRSDAPLDMEDIRQKIKTMQSRDRIFTTWKSLSKDKLNAYIQSCRAAIMPFILVPSEIPLAIIEATAFGKPVLSTTCGGTGEYVEKFGSSSPVGDVRSLAESMLKVFHDEDYYTKCCNAAVENYANHPVWSEVATGWLEAAKKVAATQ